MIYKLRLTEITDWNHGDNHKDNRRWIRNRKIIIMIIIIVMIIVMIIIIIQIIIIIIIIIIITIIIINPRQNENPIIQIILSILCSLNINWKRNYEDYDVLNCFAGS